VRVAAFDVDGTLLRGQSQAYFAKMLVQRRLARPSLMARVVWWYALMRLGAPFDQEAAQRKVVASLAGMPQARLDEVLASFVTEALVGKIRPGAVAELDRLRAEGCEIVLVSAAPVLLIERLAAHLGVAHVVATGVASPVEGRFSGRLEGPIVLGPEKVVRLREYADRTFGAWDLHAAYGDQHHDGPMLALAANPVAVSPTRELARLATAEGWAVRNW
jgi:HAD superfamily hydrolase (TIGR01490 family)